MTVEQIKDGLRICASSKETCTACPYKRIDGCAQLLLKDALDLIEFAEKVIAKEEQ